MVHVVVFVDDGALRSVDLFASKVDALLKRDEIMMSEGGKWNCYQQDNDYRIGDKKIIRILEREVL